MCKEMTKEERERVEEQQEAFAKLAESAPELVDEVGIAFAAGFQMGKLRGKKEAS